jgi:hypothetical protein
MDVAVAQYRRHSCAIESNVRGTAQPIDAIDGLSFRWRTRRIRGSTRVESTIERVLQHTLRALGPVRAASSSTRFPKDFELVARRTRAEAQLPAHYLCWFLFAELLQFPRWGQSEKVAWSVLIDFGGEPYLLEHAKFGMRLLTDDHPHSEEGAAEIVSRINRALKPALPFFEQIAQEAVEGSHVSIYNRCRDLRDRYEFLRECHEAKICEIQVSGDKRIELPHEGWRGRRFLYVGDEAQRLCIESEHLGISAVEAYFSWTEHVFVHLAVLTGNANSAKEVVDIAASDWDRKFRAALGESDGPQKLVYDRMIVLRREIRNFVAHGAFGKDGAAFLFHSRAGAVPLLLPHDRKKKKFGLGLGLEFDFSQVFSQFDQFEQVLWSPPRAPARLLLEETSLDTVMSFARDGGYAEAMQTEEAMREFVIGLSHQFDRAANMDW